MAQWIDHNTQNTKKKLSCIIILHIIHLSYFRLLDCSNLTTSKDLKDINLKNLENLKKSRLIETNLMERVLWFCFDEKLLKLL